MIRVENGMLSVEGNALQLLGEATAIVNSVIENMPNDDDDAREMSSYLLRGMLFAIEDSIKKHGFDTHTTDEERKLFAESHEKAEKAVEEDEEDDDTPPRELLMALLKALGAVDVTDDFMSDDDGKEHTDVFRDLFGDDEGVLDDLDF